MEWNAHLQKAYNDGKQYGMMISALATSILWIVAWLIESTM
jgi:hypothetical protein